MAETKWFGSFEEMRQHHRQTIGTNKKMVFEPKVAAAETKPKKGKKTKEAVKDD